MFRRVYVEIGNVCNLNCPFCKPPKGDSGFISLDLFSKVTWELSKVTKEIALHILGEPLLHPNLSDIFEISNDRGVLINLTTNGLKKESFKAILNSKNISQLNFSLHSFFANKIRIKLDDYLEPIFELTKELTRRGVYVNFRLWNIDSENSIENREILKKISLAFKCKKEIVHKKGDRKYKKIGEFLYLSFDSKFEFPTLDMPYLSNKGRCYGLDSHIGVNFKGEVLPCCLDVENSIILGDLKYQSIKKILESKRATDMRSGFLKGNLVEELCQRCSYIRRFEKY